MKPILEIRNITKKFRIQHDKQPYLSLRDSLASFFKPGKIETEDFLALNDVSFNVDPGESVGIIGKNGAGKSTLLKILSKITPPSSGKIVSRGRIASLLEVGTGFHPELTGRENIYLNGSILGMKRKEITSKFDSIVDFSGTEKFLDTPLKHFSSGMQLRLAFAVASFLDPEILIVDEVLAVGDAEFQKKCLGKMEDVSRSGRTVLFVSHDMGAINRLCTRAVLLHQGKVVQQGDVSAVIDSYLVYNKSTSNRYIAKQEDKSKKDIYFREVSMQNAAGDETYEFVHTEPITMNIDLEISNNRKGYGVFVMILDRMKRRVFAAEKKIEKDNMKLVIHPQFLVRGSYSIHAFVHIPQVEQIDVIEDVCHFTVNDTGSHFTIHGTYDYGSVFGNYSWE
jgi:lipopolysaccharide transport system ATP-binding protein